MSMDQTTRVNRRSSEAQVLEADICVVGSGAAGLMAALTAAKLGLRTVLLEGTPQIGGQLVGTLLGTICGLYSNGPRPHRLTFGAVNDLLQDLDAQGAMRARRALDSFVLQYDEMSSGRWGERALRAAGVTVVTGAILRGATMQERRIGELDVATRWGDLKVRASGYVDASGDAAIAWHAGLDVREPVTPQWGTQMITIEGFDEGRMADFDGFDVADRIKRNKERYGLEREDGFVFVFPGRGVATANLTHMTTPMDPVGATEAMFHGRDQADRVMALLRDEYPEALGSARIRAYGLPGIRQTRWIVGSHQLTLDEVRSGYRPSDAVARCSWPVEGHDSAERVHWETFASDHVHWVGLRSMAHRDADNLVAAGRCIDADTAALASVRVMGPCFAMGQAAAHALALAGRSGSLHNIDLQSLSDRLRDNLEGMVYDPWCEGAIE